MSVKAVLFDMGGTLEDVRYDRASRLEAAAELSALLAREGAAVDAEPPVLLDAIERGCSDYREVAEESRRELPPAEIWSRYYLREFGFARDSAERLAERLAWLWETRFYTRSLRPGAAEALDTLKALGYRLGVISNTSSRTQVPATLESYGLAGHFECVCLSSVSGVRKPDPSIFREALSLMGVRPEEAAYVGDTVSRDVSGARAAGYAISFQILSFLTSDRDSGLGPGMRGPDYVIDDLREIAPILERAGGGAPPWRRP